MFKLIWIILYSIGIIILNNFLKYLFNGFNLCELIGVITVVIGTDIYIGIKNGEL